MAFEAAKCPNCGGDLQVPSDHSTVKCMYCGGDIVVKQAIQAAAGGNINTWMALANAGRESGNNEEAFSYFNKVLEVAPNNYEAWFGKGYSAGWLSTLANCRLSEMASNLDKAIACAPEGAEIGLKKRCARALNEVAIAYYNMAWNHVNEFASLDNSWLEYLDRSLLTTGVLTKGTLYDPENPQILQNLIQICTNDVQGVPYQTLDAYANPVTRVHRVSPEYEQSLLRQRNTCVMALQKVAPSYQPPLVAKAGQGMCFVATAVRGSEDHPDVVCLRLFRDYYLQQYWLGRLFIVWYRSLGPILANVIQANELLKSVCAQFIVRPTAAIAKAIINDQVKPKSAKV